MKEVTKDGAKEAAESAKESIKDKSAGVKDGAKGKIKDNMGEDVSKAADKSDVAGATGDSGKGMSPFGKDINPLEENGGTTGSGNSILDKGKNLLNKEVKFTVKILFIISIAFDTLFALKKIIAKENKRYVLII